MLLGAWHDQLPTLQAEAGYRSSAGIACNKMLAKLASGLHKPDDQTILPPSVAAAFIAPLPVRCSTWPSFEHCHQPDHEPTVDRLGLQ